MTKHYELPKNEREKFIYAGNAVFALKSNKTGKYFVFHVELRQYKQSGNYYFSVKVKIDQHDWLYIGSIYNNKFNAKTASLSAKAFGFLYNNILSDQILTYHLGICARCGREIQNEESVARGIGPVCWEKMTS